MLALVEFDASLLSKTCYHADSAVIILAVIFVQAWQTRLLVFKAFAPMPTR
jgi:hypothetical protein